MARSASSSLLSIAPQRWPDVRVARSMPKHFVAHVGPELFCHIEDGIQGYLLPPLVRGISK